MSVGISTSAFYSASDTEVMEKHCAESVKSESAPLAAELIKDYDVIETAEWINKHKFRRVALQFSDNLLHCSVMITRSLQSYCADSLCVILADTKYGSCCVDEVAAQHYNIDAIVHYGHACLSPISRFPVYYVYGRIPIDTSDCCEQIRSALSEKSSDQHVIVMYDVIYHHAIGELSEKLSSIIPNLTVSSPVIPAYEQKSTILSDNLAEQTEIKKDVGCCLSATGDHFHNDFCSVNSSLVNSCDAQGKFNNNNASQPSSQYNSFSTNKSMTNKNVIRCLNREFVLPPNVDLAQCIMVYIGPNELFQSALMMTFNKCKFITYDPAMKILLSDAWNMNRMLMKRYYMIEKARDAARVGILIGTLGVQDYLLVIRRLSDLIRSAGKKCYRFAVGKLNEAKLANFAEIDVFVLIACPENSLIDSSNMFRPVVTPYEMEMACQPGRQWTGDYQVDFRQLLPGGESYYREVEDDVERSVRSEAVMDVSLVTGRIRQIGLDIEDRKDSARYNSVGTVVQKDGRIIVHNSAGEFLQGRSWQGLDPQLGETKVNDVVEGAAGLAASYQHEPK